MPVADGREGVLLRTPTGDVFQTLPLPGGKSPAAWAQEMVDRAGIPEAKWTVATAQRRSGSYTLKQGWRRVRSAGSR